MAYAGHMLVSRLRLRVLHNFPFRQVFEASTLNSDSERSCGMLQKRNKRPNATGGAEVFLLSFARLGKMKNRSHCGLAWRTGLC